MRKVDNNIAGVKASKQARVAANAIRPEDVQACPGAAKKLLCGRLMDPAIQGFDKVFRCVFCHKVHVELVYREAGNSAPNPGEETKALAVAKGQHGDTARRAEMIRQFGTPGGSTILGADGMPLNAAPRRQVKDETQRGESEAQRRERIIAKYGVRRREG